MSFILDALRKSEQDRQRGRAPDILQTSSVPAPRRRNGWLPVVGLLAGLNISLLLVLWLTRDDTAAPAPPPAAATTAQAPPPVVADPNVPRDLRRELEAPAPPPTPAPGPPAAASTPTRPSAPGADAVDYPPTLTELQLAGRVNVEPLRLDLHVYSSNPKERFVFINNARYREGEQLSAGPSVEQIVDVGVILKYEGREFLLTRD